MSRPTAPELMGVTEIVAATGIPKQTISSWAKRGIAGLPPFADLAGGPVWRKRDIMSWLISTGRLAHSGCSDCAQQGRPCGR